MFEMSSNFNKNLIDKYFNELSKIVKKNCKGYEFEIILVGGASVLLNYGFRDVTNDVDAIYINSDDLKDAINNISKKFDISASWLNADVMKTSSYSDKIREVSTFYKTYNEVLIVRTLKDEYLIAMKMVSGREYKNDISDIVGIIEELNNNGKNITIKDIDNALIKLYGSTSVVKNEIRETVVSFISNGINNEIYKKIRDIEIDTRQKLVDFEGKYKCSLPEKSINDIIEMLKKKKSK